MNHYMPVRVFLGEHAVEKNAEMFSRYGKRCVLVTGSNSAMKSGALQDVLNVLSSGGITFAVFDGISQNPSVESCIAAGRFAFAYEADFIIGIGGGSALDAAKATAVFAANPELDEEGFYEKLWQKDPLPVLLVGTTAGTGSEVTKVSVLTDSRGRKHSIHDDRLFAAAVFGDPRYTLSLPLSVTLSTGIDVLSHCAESYFNRKADDISRGYAIQGIRLLYDPFLCAAEKKELDLPQRTVLYNASILGGLAICGTGTCFPHNLGYYLTENYGIPHGFASACFLPALLAAVQRKMPAYAAQFYRDLGLREEALLRLLSLSLPEQKVRMTEEEILTALPRWENNNSVLNTCCEISTVEIREILEQMFMEN